MNNYVPGIFSDTVMNVAGGIKQGFFQYTIKGAGNFLIMGGEPHGLSA